MTSLFLTLGSPALADRGSQLRDRQLLRRIAATETTAVLALVGDARAAASVAALEEEGVRAEAAVFRAADPWTLAAPRSWPIAGRSYLSTDAIARLRAMVQALRPDVVQIEHSLLLPYVAALPQGHGARTVISLHNLGSRQYETMSRGARSVAARAGHALKARLLGRMEATWIPRYDAAVVVSDFERTLLRRAVPGVDVTVVPNGIDTKACRPLDPEPTREMLFVGNLAYEPNVDGILRFCDEVLPLVTRERPDVRLTIAGPEPSAIVRDLARRPGVTVTGRVPDLDPLYRRARVCLAPLRSGGGTRIKILEAMAFGRPVVSTRFGCEGLSVADGRDILVAESPAEFAAAIGRLLDDESLWHSVRTRARDLVERCHDWDVCVEPLLALHRRLAA